MGKLSFQLRFKTDELRSLQLPVEVRRPNLSLVSRNLVSDTIDLSPGRYFVSARLPAGQELSAEVTIGKADNQTVVLAPEIGDESPHESHEAQRFLSTMSFSALAAAPALESLGPETAQYEVALHQTRDPRHHSRIFFMPERMERIPGGIQFYLPGSDSVQFLEFQIPNERVIYSAVTISPGHRGLVVCKREKGSTYRVTTHLDNNVADLLARGLERGYLEEAEIATRSLSQHAETLVERKTGDPVAAAVGAYALLQFGELDRLHDWTENLRDWFPWLPDGAAIRAEHLARLGEHGSALTALLQLKTRGTPLFSLGLTYAIERLKLYTTAKSTAFRPAQLSDGQTLLDDLMSLCSSVDFSNAAFTMFGTASTDRENTGIDFSALM